MLQTLVKFSLKFRGVVVALACLLVAYGVYVAQNAKLDVFPNFVQPQVVIQTECPGLAPEQVELLVTLPVEFISINTESVRRSCSGTRLHRLFESEGGSIGTTLSGR